MKWISVKEKLPKHRQAVLVRRNKDNWGCKHTLADGSVHEVWRWQACKFIRGKTKKEVKESRISTLGDQDGNNLVPYCWDEFGSGCLFGQEVSHWAAITDPLRDDL